MRSDIVVFILSRCSQLVIDPLCNHAISNDALFDFVSADYLVHMIRSLTTDRGLAKCISSSVRWLSERCFIDQTSLHRDGGDGEVCDRIIDARISNFDVEGDFIEVISTGCVVGGCALQRDGVGASF